MRTNTFTAICAALLLPAAAMAQSAVDAYQITPTQLRGTARFVGMGGAFTSLGGDISTMTQNPAGLGVYRHSDFGLTFDISIRKYDTTTDQGIFKDDETIVKFDNFGYVGTALLNGTLRSINWGVSYNRLAVFDRLLTGHNNPIGTSLTNYVASISQGIPGPDIAETDDWNPYTQTDYDWLSILSYNAFMTSNVGSDEEYTGLYQNGTVSDALYNVRERGYTDEYNIDIAGNVADLVYWGIGVGIVDVSYSREANYSEQMTDALVYNRDQDILENGSASYNLYNWKTISGTGANLKFGLIVRPTDMLRIGAAIHTPTWLHLNHYGYGVVDYKYMPRITPGGSSQFAYNGTVDTPDYEYNSRLNSPWRFMIGASTVIGSKAIVSIDYERVAYGDMKMKQENYNRYGNSSYVDNTYANTDIKNYYKAANIIRVGAEYRVSRNFSVRAGYNFQTTAVKSEASDGRAEIFTSGTDPSYSFGKDTHNITLGIGYRYRSWYIDAAYQHTRNDYTYHAFTPYQNVANTPRADVKDRYNNIVISTGFKF